MSGRRVACPVRATGIFLSATHTSYSLSFSINKRKKNFGKYAGTSRRKEIDARRRGGDDSWQ